MKNETNNRYLTPTVYRGKSYVTKESILGKLSFLAKDGNHRNVCDAAIAVLSPDTEAAYLSECDVTVSTVAVIFVGAQPSDALCRYAEIHELPLLILGKLSPTHDGRIALLDSRTATLYVDPDLEILTRYARQLRVCTEASLLSPHLLPHLDALPLTASTSAPFQNSKLLSYAENGPLSLAYGEDALFDTLCSLGEEVMGTTLILPVPICHLHTNERALRTRLRALLRAGACGSFCLLFEGVFCAEDVKSVFSVLEKARTELKNEDFEYRADLPYGVCVESPLLLHELADCPPMDFLFLDLDRLRSAVFPPLASMPLSAKHKASFLSLLRHVPKDFSAPIGAQTVHPPVMHAWKTSDAHACGIKAFFIPPEHRHLWQAWIEQEA